MTTETRRPATDLDAEIHLGADSEARSTSTPTVSRTAAATAARQRKAAERAALRLAVEQVGALPDRYLVALYDAIIGEIQRRDLRDLRVP